MSVKTIAAMLLTLTVVTSLSPVWAEQTLKNLDRPIEVQLQSSLDGATTQVGQPFEAVTAEDYVYKGTSLPAGTRVSGTVAKVKESRRFARPGYFVLDVDKVTFPDGKVVDVTGETMDVDKKAKDPDSTTFGDIVVKQLPLTAVSLGTSIPLNAATDLNGGVVFAIAMGARMVTGAVLELFDKDNTRGPMGDIGYGMLRGTGAVTAYNFLKKDEAPQLTQGETIRLYLGREKMQSVLAARQPQP